MSDINIVPVTGRPAVEKEIIFWLKSKKTRQTWENNYGLVFVKDKNIETIMVIKCLGGKQYRQTEISEEQ